MYILGLNAYHGDASACIYKDGELIAASEEERFRRIKHWAGFPVEAIRFCLAEAGIDISQVDYISISRDPKANFGKKVLSALKNRLSVSNMLTRFKNLKKASGLDEEFAQHFDHPASFFTGKIVYVEHHRSHLASAFFASSFQESALLSIDGFGDFSSTMIGIGRGNQIEVIDQVTYPHSAGIFYTALTQYLGFPHYGDEYKVMGLAPYGKPVYVDELRKVLRFKDNGLFELNLSYFNHTSKGVNMSWEGGSPEIARVYSDELITLFGPARAKDEPLNDHHRNLAASVQRITEELIFHILTHLQKRTGLDKVCIAGGVAQNSVANGKFLLNTPFRQIYIPPAAHDAGTSIGSALYLYNHILKKERLPEMQHGYLGSRFSAEEVRQVLNDQQVSFRELSDEELYHEVSDCIIGGGVVGWFQGRAEFGPRALGHRSIIADPRRTDAKDILNLKIKRRESFRPFAPSILGEFVTDYFEQTDTVPFMEKVFLIRPEKRASIPAVTHVDGTGRLQTVDAAVEPKYHALIHAFYQKTGVPILLNTSFNENEPIVNTPKEALDCYLRTQMDMLVLGNCVVRRS